MKESRSTKAAKKEKPSTNSTQTYSLFVTNLFIKEARQLKKVYPNIKKSFDQLKIDLKSDPIGRSEG